MDRTRAIFGSLLVLAGVIFLLDAADVIPARDILSGWWPLLIIALGLYAMLGSTKSLTSGGILVVIGGVLLLATLDIIDIALWQLIIPLILIGAGLSLVIRGFGLGRRADRRSRVNLTGVLTEQRIWSEAVRFQSASLTSILGDLKLDLTNATLDDNGATVDAVSVLGDISIIVPRGWRVHLDSTPILGDIKDHTDHEQVLPADAPEITISGVSILGDIQIRHA